YRWAGHGPDGSPAPVVDVHTPGRPPDGRWQVERLDDRTGVLIGLVRPQQVAPGDDAEQATVGIDHRQPLDPVAVHLARRVGDGRVRTDGDRRLRHQLRRRLTGGLGRVQTTGPRRRRCDAAGEFDPG